MQEPQLATIAAGGTRASRLALAARSRPFDGERGSAPFDLERDVSGSRAA